MRYYKVLNKSKTHHGFKYDCNGLNVDIYPFNNDTICGAGGLYFTDFRNIGYWINNIMSAQYVCDVEIPEGEEVVAIGYNKFKAHSIILSNCRNIWETPELYIEAIKKDINAFQNIINPSFESCMNAIKANVQVFEYIEKQTPEMCMIAINNGYDLFQFVKKQTHELCLAAIKKDGYALRWVKEQTHELCLEAVKENGFALKWVKEQSISIIEEAVKKNNIVYVNINNCKPERIGNSVVSYV